MIYLITNDIKEKFALKAYENKLSDLSFILSNYESDLFFIVDDFFGLSAFLDYAGVSYKLVVGNPDQIIDGEFLVPSDKSILYDNFVKEVPEVKVKNDRFYSEDAALKRKEEALEEIEEEEGE